MTTLAEQVAALLPDNLVQGYVGVVKQAGAVPEVDVRGTVLPATPAAGVVAAAGDNVLVMRVANTNSWVIAFKITGAPSAPIPWLPIPLASGWFPWSDRDVAWEKPGYRKSANGMVELRGLAAREAGVGGTICWLPPGYRPRARLMFAQISGDQLARVDVYPDGQILQNGGQVSWMTLAGISYEATQ